MVGLGRKGWPRDKSAYEPSLQFYAGICIPVSFLIAIAIPLSEINHETFLLVSNAAIITSIMLASSTMAAYCIATSGDREILESLFLIMGSVLGGWIFEVLSGFFSSYVWQLEGCGPTK